MSEKGFRYLNKTHCTGRTYIAPGSDKPSELHSIFNAMVASTRPKQSEEKMTEQPKTQGRGKNKTPEQHLAEAKAMTLFGIKVLDETPRKVGTFWQVLIECERCGNRKWVNKGDLSRTKSCGCLYAERSKKKIVKPKKLAFGLDAPIVDLQHEPKTEPFEVAEIVEKSVDNEKKITLTDEQKAKIDEVIGSPKVLVSRRLVMGLADECKKTWCEEDFWEMSPAVFNALIQDTKEIYEALQ